MFDDLFLKMTVLFLSDISPFKKTNADVVTEMLQIRYVRTCHIRVIQYVLNKITVKTLAKAAIDTYRVFYK